MFDKFTINLKDIVFDNIIIQGLVQKRKYVLCVMKVILQTYTYDKIMDFTNFNNLISFGCSLTWGACMSDIFDPRISMARKDTKEKFTRKHAWGNIVASIFGLHHDNQSMAGASNRYILYKILNYDYNKDVVCVLWSHTHRHTVFKSEKRFENWGLFP